MTTAINASDFIGDVKQYAYNPAAIQRTALAVYEAINDGSISIVDATNPFVFALETSCVNTSAMMQQAAALTRRQYPASATTLDDLYLHMANTDYYNIFALPSEVKFYLIIGKQQLLDALILDVSTGISKVTIPRNTVFYAAGIPFSIQYPIDIRRLEHGDLQIAYDATVTSGLMDLTTNILDYETLRDTEQVEYIQFAMDTQQFSIKSVTSPFDSTSGFTVTVPFVDQYYAARVFVSNTNGTWREIKVTYTEQVYDPLTPTAVLQVTNNKLQVRLPLVYITTGLISGRMRVDVYQTKGPLALQLGNYTPSNFTAEFIYVDQNDSSQYTNAFTALTNVAAYSKDKTFGGRNALTFAELQSRVIQNSIGPRRIPVTPSQIQSTLLDKGYKLVKNIDTVTNRIFWATKSLPLPSSLSLATSANASVSTVITQTGLANTLQGCTEHSTGMTIGPAALIQIVNGVSSLMTKAAYQALTSMDLADMCSILNEGKYGYTPFYYVLDVQTDTFVVRPYYLDSPSILSRTFIQENPDTSLQVSIDGTYSLTKTSNGYRLVISTKSNAAYKELDDAEVFCQLMFQSESQVDKCYMLGVQQPRVEVGDERVYVFDITTLYDINSDDAIALSSFTTSTGNNRPRSALLQKFNILFGTSNATIAQTPATSIDSFLGAFQLPATRIGITHESLKLSFGNALHTLWNSYRSFAATIPYRTYLADVPRVYEQNVYDIDPLTGSAFSVVAGELVYNILHAAGDPVLDFQDNPTYLHRQGDLVLDQFNRPMPVENFQTVLNRSVDLVTLDGAYQFATNQTTLEYVQQIYDSLIVSLTSDLVKLNEEMLEKTTVYYYPSITQGVVNVLADNNKLVNLEAAQSLKVTLYVSLEVFNNKPLIASLQTTTVQTIGDYLAANSTVAISQLEEALLNKYGDDVLGTTITGLGGTNDFRVMTLVDESTKFSIRKVIKLLPDLKLAVQEDISVVFSTHGFN